MKSFLLKKIVAYKKYGRTSLKVVSLFAYAILFVSVLVAGLGAAATTEAAVTKLINFQGKLTNNDASGTNVANGTYSFEFKMYTASSGGGAVWTETFDQPSGACAQLTVTNGVFNAKLGSCNSSLPDFTGGSMYISVNFNPGAGYDGEMVPRKQIGATVYALVANGVNGDGTVQNTVSSSTALTVAKAGTDYALQVDTSAGSAVTGLKVTSAAAGGGLALATISSGTNENLTVDAKGSGTVSVGAASTGDILLGGGSASTGCTLTNSSGDFACSGNITGASTGTVGYWSRSGTTLQPSTAGDAVTTSGNISTSGSGTITSASDLAVNGSNITSTNTGTFALLNTNVTTLNLAGAATNINLGSSSGFNLTPGGNATIPLLNTKGLTITSNLSGGARSTDVLTISQADDGSNNNSENLLQLTNSDTGSTSAPLAISQVSTGRGISIAGPTSAGGKFIDITGPSAGIGIDMTSLTTGTGVNILSSAVTTGTSINLSGASTGNLADFSSSGDILRIAPTKTKNSGATTQTEAGNYLDIARSDTVNVSGGTINITGDLATLSSNCTQTLGTCTDTGKILQLTQSYASASGAVLNISGAGTGNLLAADATNASANGVSIDLQSSSSSQYALNVTANNGATNVLYARADGNVGIGTASPAKLLNVNGESLFGTETNFATGATGAMRIASNNSANYIQVLADYTRTFGLTYAYDSGLNNFQIFSDYYSGSIEPGLLFGTYSNKTNQLYLRNNGNVGIGNAAPGDKLDVTGNITLSGGNYKLYSTAPVAAATSTAGNVLLLNASDATAGTITAGAAAGGDVTITAGNAARLTSGNANGGNINLVPGSGIGTGAAGQILGPATTGAAIYSFSDETGTGLGERVAGQLVAFANTTPIATFVNNTGSSGPNPSSLGIIIGAINSTSGILAFDTSAGGLPSSYIGANGAGLNVYGKDAATNTTLNLFNLYHDSTATPTASFGTGIGFNGTSSTTAGRNMAQVAAVWTTATDASRTADIIFSNVNNAAALAETARIKANGTLSVGVAGTLGGALALNGSGSGTITIQPQAAAGTYNFNLPTTAGSSGYVLTSGGGGAAAMTWTDPAGLGVRWNSITDPTGNLSLTMGSNTTAFTFNSVTSSNAFAMSSSSLSSGSLLNLAVTGTAAASNTQKVLNISTSGANATSTQTTYGGYFSNTHTGTDSTNIGLYATATGGSNNYAAIFEGGNVGITTTTPTAKLEITTGSDATISPLSISAFSHPYITITNGGSSYWDGSVNLFGDGGGRLSVGGSILANFNNIYNGWTGFLMGPTRVISWGADVNTNDATLQREAAGLLAIVTVPSSTTYRDLKLRTLYATTSIGIGTTAPDRPLEVNSATGLGMRLTYNDSDGSATNYADLQVGSGGELNIQPSGFIANLGGGTSVTDLRFLEPSGTGTDYIGFKAPADVTTSVVWSLPVADATGCLKTASNATITIGACGAAGSAALNDVTAATGNSSIDSTNWAIGWDWSTLTTQAALTLSASGTGLTTGSVLKVTTATTGAINTNGAVSFQATGNYTSTSNNGLLNVLANSTTAGTVAKFSGTALTTGQILNITSGTALTTGSAVVLTGASYNHGNATETGNLINVAFTDATNGTATSTTNGLLVTPTINVTTGASGTKTINAIKVGAPTLTACTGGSTCTYTGLNVDTSGSLANTTIYSALFNGGNVGIGTSSPSTLLHINGATGTDYKGNLRLTSSTVGTGLSLFQTSQTNAFTSNTVQGFNTGDPVSANFSGMVTNWWHIFGGLAIIGNSSTLLNKPAVFIGANQGTEGTDHAAVKFDAAKSDGAGGVAALTGNNYLYDFENNGSSVLMITGNGNVGIGDTGPDNLLDVKSAAGQSAIAITSTGTDTDALIKFELTDNTTSFSIGVDDSVAGDPFKISTTALGTNDLYVIDSQTTTSGVTAHLLQGIAPTIASASGAEYTTATLTAPTITLTGSTAVTTAMDSFIFNAPTIQDNDATQVAITDANTLTVSSAPIAAGSTGVAVTNAVGIRVGTADLTTGSGAVTNGYGLYLDAPTGASNNYAAAFLGGNVGIGTASPASRLHVGVAPTASANFGTVSIGGGPFDGASSGKFDGSANGTSLAINEASGYTGNLIDARTNGVPKFVVEGVYGNIIGGDGAYLFNFNNIYNGYQGMILRNKVITFANTDPNDIGVTLRTGGGRTLFVEHLPGTADFNTPDTFSDIEARSGFFVTSVGVGTAAPGASLDVDTADVTGGGSTETIQVRSANQSIGLADGTTRTNQRQNQFIAPTINGVAGGGTETVDNAATLYVSAAPSGSNITFTNGPYALFVDAGTTRLDGDAIVGGSTSITETLANTGFVMGGDDLFVAGTAGVEGSIYTDASLIVGASTTYGNGSIAQSSGETLTIGTTAANLILQTTTSGDINLKPASFIANVGGGTSVTALRFLEPSGTGTDYVGFKAPADVTTSVVWSLPVADATGCLKTSSNTTITIGSCGGVPTTITVADTTDSSSFVALFEDATGDLGPKTDAGLTYNASTGTLTATAFSGPLTGNVTGNVSGSAATVTGAAQTAITSLGTLTGLTMGGDINMADNIITNIGNAGTDFVAGGGLTLAAVLTANGGISMGTQALTGTTGIIDYTDFDIDADGLVTFTSDGAGDQINATAGNADYQFLVLNAQTVDSTNTGGVLDLNIDAGNAAVVGLNIDFAQSDGATSGTDAIGQHINLTQNDADGDLFGLDVGVPVQSGVNGSIDALIQLRQLDTTAGNTTTVDNGLLIDAGGSSPLTNGISITNTGSSSAITSAINIADTTGTITTGLTMSGTFTNYIDTPNFDVDNSGNLDFSGTITAGSGNEVVTLSTGKIDADALTLTTAADGGTGTSSGSGLIARSDGIGLLQGCTDNQILKWDEASDVWACDADNISTTATVTFITGSAATYTPTAGTIFWEVYATGQGGGGGGARASDGSSQAAASGGGAGGTAYITYNSTEMGANAVYTVGTAAGAGGGNTGTNGTAGTDTTFNPAGTGATITGSGGGLGTGHDNATPAVSTRDGGAGGGATNGALNLTGGAGGGAGGNSIVTVAAVSGGGGASYWGGGGGIVTAASTAKAGVAGVAYGSGGSGAAAMNASAGAVGGAGAVGVIMIREYLPVGGSDLAEVYYTKDKEIKAGDVLSLDSSISEGVKKSSKAYDREVFGIVATKPGLVLGDIGKNAEDTVAVLVSLSGRVPVKVNTENGPIKFGDLLTPSSTPGVAMKATKAGAIIGQAMTEFDDEGVGQVLVFIKNGLSNGSKLADILPGLTKGSVESLAPKATDLSKQLLIQLTENKEQLGAAVDLSEITTDRVMAGLEIITPTLIADDVQTNTIRASTGTDVGLVLGTDGKFVIGQDSTETPSITFDALGNATFAGEVKADKISANQISGLEIITDKITALSTSVDNLEGSPSPASQESLDTLAALVQALSDTTATVDTRLTALESQTSSLATLEGLTAVTQTVTTLQEDVGVQQTALIELGTRLAVIEGQDLAAALNLSDLSIGQSLAVTGMTTLSGGLQVDSIKANGDLLSLLGDVEFFGRPYFNTDTAGFALIREGQQSVNVLFDQEYLEQPIVNANITVNENPMLEGETDPSNIEAINLLNETNIQSIFESDIRYLIVNKSERGFTIMLKDPAPQDIEFSWIALAVKGAKLFSAITEQPSAPEPQAEETTPPDNNQPPAEESTPPMEDSPLPPEETAPPDDNPPANDSNTPPAENVPPPDDSTFVGPPSPQSNPEPPPDIPAP